MVGSCTWDWNDALVIKAQFQGHLLQEALLPPIPIQSVSLYMLPQCSPLLAFY